MSENKKLIFQDEKTINLLDACFYLLGKWKVMTAAAVIMAVLAGGFSFVKSNKAYQAAKSQVSSVTEAVEMTAEEKVAYQKKLTTIEEYQQYVKETDYYLENSIKAKLDPNGYYEGTATYIFSVESGAAALETAEYCKAEVLNAKNLDELSKKLTETVDAAMLSEVVFFEESEQTAESVETVRLVWKTQHYTEADCETMLTFIEEKMQEALKDLSVRETNVKVTGIEPSITLASDVEMMSASTDMLNARNSVYENLTAVQESLTETEKAFYVQEQKKESSEKEEILEEILPETEEPSVSKKLVLVGAAAGVFLAAAYYAVIYLFDGKVHNKEELESWLAVPVLNAEKSIDVAAAMLAEMAEKAQAKKLYLTGSLDGAAAKAAEEICTAFAAKNVEVIVGADGLNTADALQQMTDCGFAAFVEKSNESKEKAIREEVVKAISCGVKILGIVLEK